MLSGWLLDVYPHAQGGTALWLLAQGGERLCLRHDFPVSFYAAGQPARLRALWQFLAGFAGQVRLERAERQDLFAGPRTVLAAQVLDAAAQPRLFRAAAQRFPDLDYYDADIPLGLRYAAAYGVYPLGACQAEISPAGRLLSLAPLGSPWELDAPLPPLRVLMIEPDCDPAHAPPRAMRMSVTAPGAARPKSLPWMELPLQPERALLAGVNAAIRRGDPDLILTNWGDTWLFPRLFALSRRLRIPFNPCRDPLRRPLLRAERSYFTYGQVVYRGRQVHLFGRWHIDQRNAMMYGDYGLEGALEQARVTGLPVQEAARKSPGAGITAMQMHTALRRGVLIPHQKQQAEEFKSAYELLRADLGGLVYQPLTGLHHDVAEIDFISMYPSVMARFNISPETLGKEGDLPEGLVPETLRPLIERRLALKAQLALMDRRDCRYASYKARAQALKWLLVVCFGYLGYKNARFGRIESHEAVTAHAREALLRAKEIAEEMGCTVLHLYVDGLWVQGGGWRAPGDFQPLLEAIAADTGLPIALEGVYRWIAFLPSRVDARLPVANRYFGAFQDGSLKMRGIEARRGDTPPFIARAQVEMLERLARYAALDAPDARAQARRELAGVLSKWEGALRQGRIPVEQMLVSQRLSRALGEYRQPSPAGRAAMQLELAGKTLRPGQRVRFLYTLGKPGVHAWDLPQPPPPAALDVKRYLTLLRRAAGAALAPLGAEETQMRLRLANPTVFV
ncbi:MAG: hypothetical protein L0Z70_16470 [Chloroflexi bacterium]|nr:hypothetical protein [Chloroflexota bacterium]